MNEKSDIYSFCKINYLKFIIVKKKIAKERYFFIVNKNLKFLIFFFENLILKKLRQK